LQAEANLFFYEWMFISPAPKYGSAGAIAANHDREQIYGRRHSSILVLGSPSSDHVRNLHAWRLDRANVARWGLLRRVIVAGSLIAAHRSVPPRAFSLNANAVRDAG